MGWFKRRSSDDAVATEDEQPRRLDDPAHQWWQTSGGLAARAGSTDDEMSQTEIERRVTLRMTRLGSRKLGRSTTTSLPSTTDVGLARDTVPGPSLPRRGKAAAPAAPAWDAADPFEAAEPAGPSHSAAAPPPPAPLPADEEILFDPDGLYRDNPELL